MKVAIIGATGWIGGHVLREVRGCGHEVTAVVRDPSRAEALGAGVETAIADATDREALTHALQDHDAVVTAYRAPAEQPDQLVTVARALLGAAKGAGVRRLVWVGSSAALKLPGSDMDVVDFPQFPEDRRPAGYAHRESLRTIRAEAGGLAWTYICMPRTIEDGERTGNYRLAGEELPFDEQGNSRISVEDFAVAIADTLDDPERAGKQISVMEAPS